LQASLSGHLLLSTFHAGSAAETVGRLFDMGIEPYALRSGVLAIVHQRLLRQLCPSCAKPNDDARAKCGLLVDQAMTPCGCPACNGAGYRGRFLLVETLLLSNDEVARTVLSSSDVPTIERMASEAGMIDRWQRATQAVNEGRTSPAEVRRVLGFS
jgi:type II secretory ATPase GspE/PulE/Tfp pilus assembly ATPase PilB-like protein